MLTNPMSVGVLFVILWVVLAVPAAVCLILSYQKSRMSGFLWLLWSVVVWPVVARSLTLGVNMIAPSVMAARGLPLASYASGLMIISITEAALGGTFLFVACFILYKQIVQRMLPVLPVLPVVAGPGA
jgi:hypothetical protein